MIACIGSFPPSPLSLMPCATQAMIVVYICLGGTPYIRITGMIVLFVRGLKLAI